ncbi:MAG TPA: hypothetical protein VMB73_22960, partial [Acetobacteraceae bacterium]|nr:hypothetical protein [Acetobacteraceae bacterium]
MPGGGVDAGASRCAELFPDVRIESNSPRRHEGTKLVCLLHSLREGLPENNRAALFDGDAY